MGRRKKDLPPEGFYFSNVDQAMDQLDNVPVIVLGEYMVRNPTQMAYPYKLLKVPPKDGDRVRMRVRNKRTNNELTFTADVRMLRSNKGYGYLNFKRTDEIQKGDTLFILEIQPLKGNGYNMPPFPDKEINLDQP